MNGDLSPHNGDISFLKTPVAWSDFTEYSTMKTMRDRQVRLGVVVNPTSKFLELDLSRRGLEEVPAEAFNFSRIEVLKVGNNKISAIANAVGHMHRLKILDVHKNMLSAIPDTILNCHMLSELNLNHNKLCSLPTNFRSMNNLKVLNLAYNCFETLPHDVAHLENLKTLDMQGNKLWHLPFNIQNLRNLRNLNIGENLFEHVPIPVCNIKNLETLSLKGNKLINIPTDFENLKLLSEVNLSNNNFETVPYIIGEVRSLQFLNMSGNQLKFLPPRLTRMAKLRTLHVQNNQISTIPNCFDNLEYLNVGHNKLHNFSVAKMKKLKSLNASHNELENLPMGLCNLPNLEIVRINNNQIRFISQDIVLLKHLRTLDLSYNKLTSLPQVINELEKLEYFCVKGNKIESRPHVINNQNIYSEEMMLYKPSNSKKKGFWPFAKSKETKVVVRTRKPLGTRQQRYQPQAKRADESKYPTYKVVEYLEGARQNQKRLASKSPQPLQETEEKEPGTPTPVSKVKRPISDVEDTVTQGSSLHEQSRGETSDLAEVSLHETQMSTTTDYALIGLCNQVEALLNRDLLQPIISHKVNNRQSPSPAPNQNSSKLGTDNSTSKKSLTSNGHYYVSQPLKQPLVVRDHSAAGQAWLLRTKSDSFLVTQYGGTFRSKVDPNVKLFVPPDAVLQPMEVTLQIEKVDQEGLLDARTRSQDKLLHNLLGIGDIVHTEQNSTTDFMKPVTLVIPAPPTIKRGKLHIMSYKEDNTCSVSTTAYRQQRGYLTFQTWRLSGGKGSVLTKAKCKYKACRSVELLLQHLYL